MKRTLFVLSGPALALVAVASVGAVSERGASAWEGMRDDTHRARVDGGRVGTAQDFMPLYQVLLSPRCVNCHPAGDTPAQGDHMAPHAMNISRVSQESGLHCTTCHRERNSSLLHGPPGAHDWHMPPRETPMVFEGQSPSALCAQLKDRKANGGKTLADLVDHMDHDAIVLWGWSPGGARTLPPVPHATLMQHVRDWANAGAPCP